MKFLLINTDYEAFQHSLYAENPGLETRPYQEQMRVRWDSLFGMADFYSTNLRALGCEAWEVIGNLGLAQAQWAKENGAAVGDPGGPWRMRLRRGVIPWLYRDCRQHLINIVAAQIKFYRPDVLYCLALHTFGSDFLRSVKGYYGMAVGQHASQMPGIDLSEYDLILSSLPNQVEQFRRQGIDSEIFRLGFEPNVLSFLTKRPPEHAVTFVGGVGGNFSQGTHLLEELCRRQPVQIWGYGVEQLPTDSPLRLVHHGPAWGRKMYQILQDSKIVFNRHIDFAENHANNMRLYESTGVGAMLLTDQKSDLHEIFVPGREMVAYQSAEECVELVKYYLEHEAERQAIALAGQERTLRDYNYRARMEELVALLESKRTGKPVSRKTFS